LGGAGVGGAVREVVREKTRGILSAIPPTLRERRRIRSMVPALQVEQGGRKPVNRRFVRGQEGPYVNGLFRAVALLGEGTEQDDSTEGERK